MTANQMAGFKKLAGVTEYMVVALLPKTMRADATRLLEDIDEARALVLGMVPATESDWTTEYLAPTLAVRIVDDLDAACALAEEAGAEPVGGHEDDDEIVRVFRDPAGHPFCLFVRR